MRKLCSFALFLFLASFGLFSQNTPFLSGTYIISSVPGSSDTEISVDALFTIPPGYYQSYSEKYFTIDIEGADIAEEDLAFPEGDTFRGETPVQGYFKFSKPDSGEIILLFNYQFCEDSGTCYFPKTFSQQIPIPDPGKLPVEGTFLLYEADYEQLSTGMVTDDFPSFTDASVREGTIVLENFASVFPRYLIILLLAFSGGILLNIMPCVLPVLSLKTLHLVQLRDKSRKEYILHGISYSLGIITTLLALGIAAAVLKSLGQVSGWGFQFQNPYFTVSLIALLFVFALAMFDLYVIQLPGITLQSGGSKKGLGSAFSNGILAVLLATPCTAPFMGSALGLAFTLGPVMIILSFLSIGIGLSLPFLLVSFFPSFVSWIPKPGKWMETFKNFLGFLLFATIGWLLNSAFYQIGWNGLLKLFYAFILISLLLWYFGILQSTHRKAKLRKILVITVLLLSVASVLWIPAGSETEDSSVSGNWRPFSEETLKTEQERGNRVFIAFSAEWCLTCKTNEITVLNTNDIQALFAENNVTLLYGDYTNQDPVITRWIEYFGKSGVPVYAYYAPGKEPVILPELLTKRTIRNLFRD